LPLDLDRVVTLCSRLTLRDRDSGARIPFKLRPQQLQVIEQAKEHMARGRRLYMIFLKARRLGISSLANAIQIAHIASKPDTHAAIIAQIRETSTELFGQASNFAKDLLPINPGLEIVNKQILYPHQGSESSNLRHYTAATVQGTRGLTLSSVHMTEAAFYPYEGAYKSILNTLSSKDPDNICLIETTANGMEGAGEAYYEYWQAAEAGENEFLPIFLPWFQDDNYVADPADAKDAPRDDYEKWLMNDLVDPITHKPIKLGKDRIAWFRQTLHTKCESSIDSWRAEFPSTAGEAFIASGSPAFTHEEIQFAEHCKSKPLHYGTVVRNSITGKAEFQASSHPDENLLAIWEFPQPGHHYFAGVDTARGDGNNVSQGDYAAIVVWNGETGEMAARFMSRVSPETIAAQAGIIGRFFNNAVLNVEVNGLGYIVMSELRDRHFYPNQHRWMGRNDKFDHKPGTALGFETSSRHRSMMFNVFRTALYRKEALPKDKVFISQMEAAKMEGFRWDIAVGHDDVFFAGLLGWIAKEQMHPMACQKKKGRNLMLTTEELAAAQIALTGKAGSSEDAGSLTWMNDASSTAFGALLFNSNDHLRFLERYNRKKNAPNRLAGI
jgi:hypothetical protein